MVGHSNTSAVFPTMRSISWTILALISSTAPGSSISTSRHASTKAPMPHSSRSGWFSGMTSASKPAARRASAPSSASVPCHRSSKVLNVQVAKILTFISVLRRNAGAAGTVDFITPTIPARPVASRKQAHTAAHSGTFRMATADQGKSRRSGAAPTARRANRDWVRYSCEELLKVALHLPASRCELALISCNGTFRHVFENRSPAQRTASIGPDDESIRFHFSGAELLQIGLHIRFVVIVVARVIEPLAAARLQVIDPRETVLADEVGVQSESIDLQVVRQPPDRAGEIGEIAAQKIRDVQPARIVVTAVQENAALIAHLPISKAPHNLRAPVDII